MLCRISPFILWLNWIYLYSVTWLWCSVVICRETLQWYRAIVFWKRVIGRSKCWIQNLSSFAFEKRLSEHFLQIVITSTLISVSLFREHKPSPLLITATTSYRPVLQDPLSAERCEGATQAFRFQHEKARCAQQTMCVEILVCWCPASWCRDYRIFLAANSLGISKGISISERDFEDDGDLSYLKCQWLLNCISYFQLIPSAGSFWRPWGKRLTFFRKENPYAQ